MTVHGIHREAGTVEFEQNEFFSPKLARLISPPVVLGSEKSGALSPTSIAVLTPASARPASSMPIHNRILGD